MALTTLMTMCRLLMQFEKMKANHDLELDSMETAYQNKFKVDPISLYGR